MPQTDVPTVPRGSDFKQARQTLGVTQRELAAKADCSQAVVSKVEQGNGSVASRRAVSDALQRCRADQDPRLKAVLSS